MASYYYRFGRIPFSTLRMALVSFQIIMLTSTLVSVARGQTATWEWKAQGQTGLYPHWNPYIGWQYTTWPNNTNWSQQEVWGDPYSDGEWLMVQPSNWSTPNYPTSGNVVINSGPKVNCDVQVNINSMIIANAGSMNMQFGSSISATAIDLQNDGTITVNGGGGGWPGITITNGGSLTKSAGMGISSFDPGISIFNTGGKINCISGTLQLPGNNSLYTNTTFVASTNATIDLAPSGHTARFVGTIGGSGAGTVRLTTGSLATSGSAALLDFPAGLFQWTGGSLSSEIQNIGTITLIGSNTKTINGLVMNAGKMNHEGTGNLNIPFGSSFINAAGGTYELRGDGTITVQGGSGGAPTFTNLGQVKKSSGTGTATLEVTLNNAGSVEVASGTLSVSLANQVSGSTLTGGTWIARANSNLNIAAGSTITTNQGIVILDGAGSIFSKIDTIADNQGTFQILAGRSFTTQGDLANSGLLLVDGGGTFTINGILTGLGITEVSSGSNLNATSIFQNTLIIGTHVMSASTALGGTATVPEPTALVLLAMGLVGLIGLAWRKRFVTSLPLQPR
jgi:fibronectin-binding autotransporter adhesin